ncbi:peroxisome biogenesis protein 19-2-like [Dioscorea cayenensis subsp. rotundata]|uniref:Peroxisome biogenesis protein 19-2-like n=1 Tax=Dioscorea cayennensis subsp. rotundata TaxID=55577 RepID=A0AB40CT47_DIOCR|nr:peroxisome biogenesis protein 19-2-like [Dioscorea cayenensis subsp. rotundata]
MADDLDELLDSALDDFKKIDLAPEWRSNASSSTPVQGLGLGLPDLKAKKKVKQRAAAATMKTGSSHASEALEKLTQQTREAVRGLESATASAGTRGTDADGLQEDETAMVEEFIKKFEELTGSQDMESIMDTVMQQLLSKDILHEPMKEIGERYPKWLEEHKDGLSKEEYGRYHQQYELILKLNEAFEHEPDNFNNIVDLMQKMQECGQPPDDIVQELAPELDLRNLGGQLSPDMEPTKCCIM